MIEIIRTGGQICIVDSGRYKYRRYGVPLSGAMDLHSAARANSLVNNAMNEGLLELSMPGHQLLFHDECSIGIAGAQGDLELNGNKIYTDHAYQLKAKTILSVGALRKGSRIYLSIPGGIQSAVILGSRSPLPGFLDRTLGRGDHVKIIPSYIESKTSSVVAPFEISINQKIQCSAGPEWYLLTQQQQELMLEAEYRIDNKSNRMGYRLYGEATTFLKYEMLSSSVMPGTVQLLPNGLPLILMRDSQTTGGYPRILQVTEEDINQLAQRRAGNIVQFKIIL